jgi:formiminotetrahydrofolate cyclodeaminase
VRATRTEGGAAAEEALRNAARIPAALAERAKTLDRDLIELKERADPKVHSDIMTALGLSRAARAGGIAAAKANLAFIGDEAFRREIENQLDRRPEKS